MRIFPNPASAREPITVFLDEILAGPIEIRLLDRQGRCLQKKHFRIKKGCAFVEITLDPAPPAVYQLWIEHMGKTGIQWLVIR